MSCIGTKDTICETPRKNDSRANVYESIRTNCSAPANPPARIKQSRFAQFITLTLIPRHGIIKRRPLSSPAPRPSPDMHQVVLRQQTSEGVIYFQKYRAPPGPTAYPWTRRTTTSSTARPSGTRTRRRPSRGPAPPRSPRRRLRRGPISWTTTMFRWRGRPGPARPAVSHPDCLPS